MRAQVDDAAVSWPLLHSAPTQAEGAQPKWVAHFIGPTDCEGKKTEEGGRKLARTTTMLIGSAAITKYGKVSLRSIIESRGMAFLQFIVYILLAV